MAVGPAVISASKAAQVQQLSIPLRETRLAAAAALPASYRCRPDHVPAAAVFSTARLANASQRLAHFDIKRLTRQRVAAAAHRQAVESAEGRDRRGGRNGCKEERKDRRRLNHDQIRGKGRFVRERLATAPHVATIP